MRTASQFDDRHDKHERAEEDGMMRLSAAPIYETACLARDVAARPSALEERKRSPNRSPSAARYRSYDGEAPNGILCRAPRLSKSAILAHPLSPASTITPPPPSRHHHHATTITPPLGAYKRLNCWQRCDRFLAHPECSSSTQSFVSSDQVNARPHLARRSRHATRVATRMALRAFNIPHFLRFRSLSSFIRGNASLGRTN